MNNKTVAEMPKEKTKVGLGVWYSMSGAALQFSWYMINTYLTIFYTDVVGLTATAVSAIMLIARIWDAVNDPMMGVIADRTHTRWGKYRPYIMIAPPFMAIFNILTFTVFPVQGVLKVILCLVSYIGAGMLYTVLGTAVNSIVNVIASDSKVRMNYITMRSTLASVVSIFLSAFAMPMILYFGKSDTANAKGYFITTTIFSVITVILFWLCAWKSKETVTLDLPEGQQEIKKVPVSQTIKAIGKNKQLLIVVGSTILGSIAVMGRMSMLSYYVIYCMGSYTLISPMYTIMTITCLIGTMLIPVTTKLMGKKNTVIVYNLLAVVCCFIIYFVPTNNVILILIITAVIGITNCTQYVVMGMISDCADYGELEFHSSDVGTAYAMLGFGAKLATAISGSVCVLLLGAIGYVAGADQTESVKTGISFVVNLFPAICMLIGTIPMLWYKLTETKVADIQRKLKERNKNAEITE